MSQRPYIAYTAARSDDNAAFVIVTALQALAAYALANGIGVDDFVEHVDQAFDAAVEE
jgi:hypothetical protein